MRALRFSFRSKISQPNGKVILLQNLNQIGLGTLTYTPAPMNFLNKLFKRPENEKPLMIIATGYPGKDYIPPTIKKKTLKETIFEF
jgi:iodotyrosine deiodinase